MDTGYRVATPSFIQRVCSWRYLHNETGKCNIRQPFTYVLTKYGAVNIFSHLLAGVLFYTLPCMICRDLGLRYRIATTGDIAVFAIYLLGVAVCYTLSFTFHTLMSQSARGFAFGNQLNFQAIIFPIWSATAPMIYHTFLEEPILQRVYWSLTSCVALLASIITFTPAFRKPATKPLRATVFGSLALSTLIGVLPALILHGWDKQDGRFPMWAIGFTLLFNILGAGVYVLRFPERWWRRTFDIFGASHQLMHISIVIASLVWLRGMIKALDDAHARHL